MKFNFTGLFTGGYKPYSVSILLAPFRNYFFASFFLCQNRFCRSAMGLQLEYAVDVQLISKIFRERILTGQKHRISETKGMSTEVILRVPDS